MKRKTMTGVFGLVLLIGAGVAVALTPPPPPYAGNGMAPPAGVEPGPPQVAGEQGPPPPPAPRADVERPAPPPPGREIPPVEGAETAVSTVREIARSLKPGPVWERRDPVGGVELKAALVYGKRCVAVLTLDPKTGEPLPLGWRPPRNLSAARWKAVKGVLSAIVERLKPLDGAEFLEPENAWAVPIAYRGEIVAHLKIARDGRQVIPDYPAEQEMRALGQ